MLFLKKLINYADDFVNFLDVDLTDVMICKILPHMRKRALGKYDQCK